ncbi:MAG: hypothetical protein A3H68_02400 [Candidatus Taylorbacteria bacterium RIFCSPLOWO2_02_FULL_46_40]|uniref:Uncharacterized protein n=1 Tax=Candidatus Taylorbacteria bacterium RIFCSPLOWO2_02_FULL_46_40 TaxID=1802329 RepID=A0A1G2P0Q1_9BACT|nr:MAG: hypothetical protein A3H68_02400 [Candidatus Taylorbacteria bacterium RIFCSPLOWO2_02_FULL_46_40]
MKLARNSHETLHNKGARPRTTPFTKVPETATLFDQKSEQYGTFYLESAFLFGYIYSMDRDNIKKDSDLLESVLDADQRSTNDFKRKIISKDGLVYINKKHLAIVKEITGKYGVGEVAKYSQKAYKCVIVIALHSGDVEFLKSLTKELQNTTDSYVERRDIAFLTDKLKILQNRPQMYGTQYKIKKDGVVDFIDIERPDEVDRRREKLGMESFEEYRKMIAKNSYK